MLYNGPCNWASGVEVLFEKDVYNKFAEILWKGSICCNGLWFKLVKWYREYDLDTWIIIHVYILQMYMRTYVDCISCSKCQAWGTRQPMIQRWCWEVCVLLTKRSRYAEKKKQKCQSYTRSRCIMAGQPLVSLRKAWLNLYFWDGGRLTSHKSASMPRQLEANPQINYSLRIQTPPDLSRITVTNWWSQCLHLHVIGFL